MVYKMSQRNCDVLWKMGDQKCGKWWLSQVLLCNSIQPQTNHLYSDTERVNRYILLLKNYARITKLNISFAQNLI